MDEKERLVRIKKYLDMGILECDAIDPDDLKEILKLYNEENEELEKNIAQKIEIISEKLQEN